MLPTDPEMNSVIHVRGKTLPKPYQLGKSQMLSNDVNSVLLKMNLINVYRR